MKDDKKISREISSNKITEAMFGSKITGFTPAKEVKKRNEESVIIPLISRRGGKNTLVFQFVSKNTTNMALAQESSGPAVFARQKHSGTALDAGAGSVCHKAEQREVAKSVT